MKKIIQYKIIFLFSLVLLSSCVDPYHLESTNFEDAVVIEATITNELKKQEIKISRTFRFEEDGPTFESGANVYVVDDLGTNYEFEEVNGRYVSVSEFQALPQRKYELNVTTSNGKSYASSQEILTTATQITDVNAIVTTQNGDTGVELRVNSFDPTGTSKYYRYEYEETFKIISPSWKALDVKYSPPPTDAFVQMPRNPDTQVCYSTVNSENLILESTTDLSEDRIQDFPVRFISNQNYIISHRYSILVKQYVENLAAFTFFETLKKLSSSESILSQTQPGFLMGNIKSTSDANEKVIGFFDVASVSSKRIFFNYADLFPGQPLPPFIVDCVEETFDEDDFGGPGSFGERNYLREAIANGRLIYFNYVDPIYTMVPTPCGDCTSFSSNIVPSFWIE